MISLMTACCNHPKSKDNTSDAVQEVFVRDTIEPAVTDTILIGDVNKDGILDTAFVYTPPTIRDYYDDDSTYAPFNCLNNECDNRITFSCNLPELVIYNSVWARVECIDDLDGDGIREILVAPNWFWSCVGSLKLYSLKGNEWKEILSVQHRRCTDRPLSSFHVKRKGKNFLEAIDWTSGDEESLLFEIKMKK